MVAREIDRLVAERIFCRKVTEATGVDYVFDEPPPWVTLPSYSTDLKAAWSVAEKLQSEGYGLSFDAFPGEVCGASILEKSQDCCWKAIGLGKGKDLPMALCLAALRAKGIEVPK